MARYQILYWKDFPAQVKAGDEQGNRAKALLPDRFSEAIDAAAMAEGSTESSVYLDAWEWGPKEERKGKVQEVVDIVIAELDADYPQSRLREMIRNKKALSGGIV